MDKLNRPDFIIIGAMKSATSSLQKQLELQNGIFMSEPKEPNFFSNDEIFSHGERWYSNLFRDASPVDLKGEASTHYTKLPRYPDTVERLKNYAPEVKLVYVMRQPIDRLISHYVHNWSMGFVNRKVSIEPAISSYGNFIEYGLYFKQLIPWFEKFGKENILPVFFDRLLDSPQSELERICSFIGYSGQPCWIEEADASNVSGQRLRKFPLYSLVVESSLGSCARRTFVPKSFRETVKSRLRLADRPDITSETRIKLETIFDEDLESLGTLLGVELNCKNFKDVTSASSLDWVG